jgi:hypothetical protein
MPVPQPMPQSKKVFFSARRGAVFLFTKRRFFGSYSLFGDPDEVGDGFGEFYIVGGDAAGVVAG